MSNCEKNKINKNIKIVDFFDNIPENNDNINLFTKIAINKVKKLLNKENKFENIKDTENTDSEIESIVLTIVTKNIDDNNYEIKIPQIASLYLTSCALINKIDEKIQRCGDTKNLRGIICDKFCLEHSISIGGKNLLLLCIDHKLCPVLQINEPFTVSAKLQQVFRFLCCDCYEKYNRYLYVRSGRRKIIQECETQAIEQSLNITFDESSFANNNYNNTISIYKSPILEKSQSLEEYCSALPVELYNLLNVLINVLGVTRRYERCLETQRMELADLTLRIQQLSNIWNVCVIDNIDFKEKTFTYGNIYDTTRTSSYATLRLLFQFKLPIEINSIFNDKIQLDKNTKLFGENSITKEVITIFNSIFIQLLNFYINNNFSIQYLSSYNV
ncbi:hypothetical protein Glove_330g51 [Diversispora epigaea]|uniref:Uncharacterized protein n=1 Tax=Diversispora epigaea TaxID=1348612 RepID=A0A397HMU2_9GLOM|nr:hypothetical protein Glove_330g51 [Diversispora epigaea]